MSDALNFVEIDEQLPPRTVLSLFSAGGRGGNGGKGGVGRGAVLAEPSTAVESRRYRWMTACGAVG